MTLCFLKGIISNNSIHTVVPPDDGPRYARNVWRFAKYTKNKLCIKLVFLYTIISRGTLNKTQNSVIEVLNNCNRIYVQSSHIINDYLSKKNKNTS